MSAEAGRAGTSATSSAATGPVSIGWRYGGSSVGPVQYLSDEWMDAAAEALAASDLSGGPAGDDGATVVEYEVSGAPGGKARYAVRFDADGVTLEPGAHPDAPVRFSLDYPTAVEVATGELSAQAAFMQGRLKLGGDVTVLIEQHDAIEGLADVLGGLRERTEF